MQWTEISALPLQTCGEIECTCLRARGSIAGAPVLVGVGICAELSPASHSQSL